MSKFYYCKIKKSIAVTEYICLIYELQLNDMI